MADFVLTPTTFTIAEYCGMLDRNEVIVNRDYQRSEKVWPVAAQSFLIETILLGYQIPKLSLRQITDLTTRKTVKEIVDGQQRTRAIKAFYDNKLRLSRTLDLPDAAGCTYENLSPDLQQTFLDYPISIDLFTGASNDEIREVFRRINSYTVPLNPEEHRHAVRQGDMKWFVYKVTREYDAVFLRLGTFTPPRLARMADTKLIAEIIHAVLNGITTTNKSALDHLYEKYDTAFPQKDEVADRLDVALNLVIAMEELHGGPLMKAHMIYALLLAIMHVLNPIDTLQGLVTLDRGQSIVPDVTEGALSELATALDDENADERYKPFIEASIQKTNVRAQREVRFRWFVEALQRR